MKRTFSTGELAKLCNVSVRTVQYYDKKGILKPSELSEGGRRIYTEDDLNKFHCICLYKTLGFSLGEIKRIMETENTYCFLSDTITSQLGKINNEILLLEQTKERLTAVLEQINESGKVKVESIEDLDNILVKKNHHKKTDIMTYIFLGCYVLLLLIGFPYAFSIGGIVPLIMITMSIILMLGLVYYHSEVNAYACTKCHSKFSIGFWKDLYSPNGVKKDKYLECPYCGYRGWFKETYLD